jgi:hypothetical protein
LALAPVAIRSRAGRDDIERRPNDIVFFELAVVDRIPVLRSCYAPLLPAFQILPMKS